MITKNNAAGDGAKSVIGKMLYFFTVGVVAAHIMDYFFVLGLRALNCK